MSRMYAYSPGDEPCPYCGTLRGDLPKSTLYLPHSAVLEGRYFLGNPLWSSSFLIAYMGWDSLRSERCTLVEYHPQSLVRRVPERKLVLPVTPSKAEAFSEGRELFRRESEILASFDEELSLIPLWNFFDFGGSIWRVTEYGEGRSLGEFFSEPPDPSSLGAGLPAPLSRGASPAPGLRKVRSSCNLGPWSLRVRSQDRALLLGDYGMVRREWDEKQEKSLPFPLGGYSPFEFYRGKEPSERSTLFTLGALLFRMSTGEFLTDPVEWIDSEMARRVGRIRNAFPLPCERGFSGGSPCRPEDRYSGIREFWSLLGKALGRGGSLRCPPPGLLSERHPSPRMATPCFPGSLWRRCPCVPKERSMKPEFPGIRRKLLVKKRLKKVLKRSPRWGRRIWKY